LTSLPARERHALLLSVLEGRPCREIGEMLGVSTATAKRLVARRRTLFR
jgi:RNA polymerase sigma factor (sigma-70 family)